MHVFVDALCPDILEALVHCLLVLQGSSPEVNGASFTESTPRRHTELQLHTIHHPTVCATASAETQISQACVVMPQCA